jgi:hypothetical protein
VSESNISVNEENNDGEGEQSVESRDESAGNDTNAKGKRAKRNDVVEELSQEDIEIFLENESVMAAQTSSQEVRSHHVPHLNQVFDTHDASFDFYNTYSEIIGFSAKRAGNYHCRLPGRNNEVTRYTFKCNRSGKPVDDEILEERKRKKELKRQDAKKKKLQ